MSTGSILNFPKTYVSRGLEFRIDKIKRLYDDVKNDTYAFCYEIICMIDKIIYGELFELTDDAIKRIIYGFEIMHGMSVSHSIDNNIVSLKPQHICISIIDIYNLKKRESRLIQYIYTLGLLDGKYYVGRSKTPTIRIDDHTKGLGSQWTTFHKPCKVLDVIEMKDDFDEDKCTLQLMREKGIDNVRGGTFCEIILKKENIAIINKMIQGSENRCYFCGKTGHYLKSCYAKRSKKNNEDIKNPDTNQETKCDRCGKKFDTEKGMRYHQKTYCQHIDGNPDIKTQSVKHHLTKRKTIKCFRCARENHISTKCYASTHIDGSVL